MADIPLDNAEFICPSCAEVVDPVWHFCDYCGSPLTSHAQTDPMGQIYSEGFGLRKAINGRPGKLILAGVWLLLAPQVVLLFIFSFAMLSQTLSNSSLLAHRRLSIWIGPGIRIGIMLVYFVLLIGILWRVTRSFLKKRIEEPESDEGEALPPG